MIGLKSVYTRHLKGLEIEFEMWLVYFVAGCEEHIANLLSLNPKAAGREGQFDHRCGFSKNVSSVGEMWVKPGFFVTFNIILRHIFHENFIKLLQVVQKI